MADNVSAAIVAVGTIKHSLSTEIIHDAIFQKKKSPRSPGGIICPRAVTMVATFPVRMVNLQKLVFGSKDAVINHPDHVCGADAKFIAIYIHVIKTKLRRNTGKRRIGGLTGAAENDENTFRTKPGGRRGLFKRQCGDST